MSILGNRVHRVEDPKFLTVGGTYVADVSDERLAGAAHAAYARSVMAHADVHSVETDEASAMPGVLAVYTAADLDLEPIPTVLPMLNPAMKRPWLAGDRVRFVGEPIAVVVAETAGQAADAAELVWADYEPRPVVIDAEAALDTEAERLFPEADTNVAVEFAFGSSDDLFDGCDVVVDGRFVNQRVAGCPLEVRSAAAAWVDRRLVHWSSTQAPQALRDALTQNLGLDAGDVLVIAPDVGGGFGPKIGSYPEEMLLGWLAGRVERPVRWTETRSENMVAMGHGRAQVQTVTIGGTADGRVQAYRLGVVQDAGAYPALGAFLPYFTRTMAAGVYDIPTVECNTVSVVTNTMSTVAYRGAGRPEATGAIERAMDLYAAEIGMDPAEVRRRNLVAADAFPYTTAVETVYDSGDYERALDLALEEAGYEGLRHDQARRRGAGSTAALGIGVSTYVEITAGPTAQEEHARVEVLPDGSAKVYTGTSPHGQGHATSWAMIAGERLGIAMDQIDVVHGDTDLVPKGVGTFGSRSLQVGGSAVHEAAGEVVDQARQIAAEILEASAADIVLDRVAGAFHVAGTPARSVPWGEIAGVGDGGLLAADVDFHATSPTFPFGAHVAVVEVDIETGHVTLVRHITCDDAGRILNPMIVEGQRHGGIAQGAAQALLEEVRYDDDGNPVTSNLADYGMISATELPSFELVPLETPTPHNPLGAKGIGESGTIGSTPAVQSAVVDAVAHLGVRHIDIPCTPERVWTAIRAAGPATP